MCRFNQRDPLAGGDAHDASHRREILIRADNRTAIRALRELGLASKETSRQVGESWRKTGTAMQGAGRMMTSIGVGVGAFGYEAVKQSMNFQTAMTRIQTQAGASAKTVDLLTKAVLDFGGSGKSQFSPTDLALGLYHIMSVSKGTYKELQNSTTAMNVLKVAAKGAAIGGANLEDTTTALMGVMVASHAPIKDAAKYMALMNSTVGVGNMRMPDLVNAMSSGVVPAFKLLHLTAKDAFAAVALFADQGTKAASSSRQLATSLHYLVQPSTKAQKFLHAIGMDPEQLSRDLNGPGGLLKALDDLQANLKPYDTQAQRQVIYALLPGGRGRILQQAINNLEQLHGKQNAITESTAALNKAGDVQAKTLAGKLHSAWAVIQTDMTKFGDALQPIIEKYLPPLMRHLEDFFHWLNKLSPATKDLITKLVIGFAIGGPIVYGLGRVATLVGQTASAMKALYSGAKMVLPLLAKLAGLQFPNLPGGGPPTVPGGGPKTPGGTGKVAAKAAKASRAQRLGRVVKTAGRGVGLFLPVAGEVIAIGMTAEALGLKPRPGAKIPQTIFGNPRFGGAQGGFVTPEGIRHYGAGGYVDSVPAMLSPGEGVLNRAAMASLGTSAFNSLNRGDNGGLSGFEIQSTPVYVMLDGRVIAKSVLQHTLRKAARGSSSLVGGSLVTGYSVPVNRGLG